MANSHESALEVIALVSRDSERGVDAWRRALREGDALVMCAGSDELGGGSEPDVWVEVMFGTHETIDERDGGNPQQATRLVDEMLAARDEQA
jgi:hypothetical protein